MQFFRDCDEVAQQSEIQGHLLFVFFWFGLSGASISIHIPPTYAPPGLRCAGALPPMRCGGRRLRPPEIDRWQPSEIAVLLFIETSFSCFPSCGLAAQW